MTPMTASSASAKDFQYGRSSAMMLRLFALFTAFDVVDKLSSAFYRQLLIPRHGIARGRYQRQTESMVRQLILRECSLARFLRMEHSQSSQ